MTAPTTRRRRDLRARRSAPIRRSPARPRRVLTLVVALLLAAATACSAGGEVPSDGGGGPDAAGVPMWSGDGDFYAPPDPLPLGKAGDLIRVEALGDDPRADVDTYRIMYHSRTKDGADVAATGLVYVPRHDAPDGGWPIVASLHGTDGMISACAPSRKPEVVPLSREEPDYLVVVPDYTGLGPTGQRHPYISGIPEGRSTIDGVRAARQLDIPTRDQWVVYGLSQGGHAAIFTAEIAPTYSPELELLGAIAMAPVGDLTDLEPYFDSPQRGLVPMFLFGLAEDNPDLDPAAFLSDEAMARADVIDHGCADEILSAYRGDFDTADLFEVDPRTDPDAKAILEANSPGSVKTPVPVLILHGIEDPIVPPSQSIGIYERECALGMTVRLSEYQGSNHAMVLVDAGDEISTWIADRFAGRPAASNCDSGPAGTAPPDTSASSSTGTSGGSTEAP